MAKVRWGALVGSVSGRLGGIVARGSGSRSVIQIFPQTCTAQPGRLGGTFRQFNLLSAAWHALGEDDRRAWSSLAGSTSKGMNLFYSVVWYRYKAYETWDYTLPNGSDCASISSLTLSASSDGPEFLIGWGVTDSVSQQTLCLELGVFSSPSSSDCRRGWLGPFVHDIDGSGGIDLGPSLGVGYISFEPGLAVGVRCRVFAPAAGLFSPYVVARSVVSDGSLLRRVKRPQSMSWKLNFFVQKGGI